MLAPQVGADLGKDSSRLKNSGEPITFVLALTAIALQDAFEFLRIIFEQVQILIRQINTACANMFLELGKRDQHQFGSSADFAIFTFAVMRYQFVEECLGFFQWCLSVLKVPEAAACAGNF